MKPWHTKKWKRMREERLGDECVQCRSVQPPLVIQHLSHEQLIPPQKHELIWELINERNLYPQKPEVFRDGCPKCRKISIQERKSIDPKWKCRSCSNEFDEPSAVSVKVSSRSKKGRGKEEHDEFWKKRKQIYNEFQSENKDLIEQKYQELSIGYEQARKISDDRYMSGEGTVTFCKKCAYLWDIEGKRLCRLCKKDYHEFKYKHCYECLPNDRKEEIQEIREFMDRMKKIHDSLEDFYE